MTTEERIESILNECKHNFISFENLHGDNEQGIRIIEDIFNLWTRKKPLSVDNKYWACPNCKGLLMVKWVTYPINPVPLNEGRAYCDCCGQHISWEE